MESNKKVTNELLNPNEILTRIGINSDMVVADLGCGGTGQFVLSASQLVGDDGLVYAVDILKEVLSAVNGKVRLRNYSNIEMIWSNLEIFNATRIPEASLDAAFLINILHQTNQIPNVLKESLRLLKSGGTLLVMDQTPEGFSFMANPGSHLSQDSINGLCKQFGLDLVDQFYPSKYYYAFVYKKL